MLGFCMIWFWHLSVCRSVWGASLDNKKIPLVWTFVFITKNISKLNYNISSKYDNPYPKLLKARYKSTCLSKEVNIKETLLTEYPYVCGWLLWVGVGSLGKKGWLPEFCIKFILMNSCKFVCKPFVFGFGNFVCFPDAVSTYFLTSKIWLIAV